MAWEIYSTKPYSKVPNFLIASIRLNENKHLFIHPTNIYQVHSPWKALGIQENTHLVPSALVKLMVQQPILNKSLPN